MPLDNFDLILGIEFFVAPMVQMMPYRKCIIIMGLKILHVIPVNINVSMMMILMIINKIKNDGVFKLIRILRL